MDDGYFLDVGRGFTTSDSDIVSSVSDCYKVWAHDSPMPGFYGGMEVLTVDAFESFGDENSALRRRGEIGNVPVYWLRHENGGRTLAVSRIK